MFKKLLVNISLFIIAVVSVALLSPIGFLYSIIRKLVNKRGSEVVEYISNIFYSLAADLDRTGNYLTGDLLNDILSVSGAYRYGNIHETISSALGKNQVRETVTRFGWFFIKFLDYIDPNHCIDAINNRVNNGFRE